MVKICVAISCVCVMVGVTLLVYQSWKFRKMTERLRAMLEAAENGCFHEYYFDESVCSSLESEMADYLNASEKSMKTVAAEKDKIKTLIADISHQTKTPISNLLLYAELLRENETKPENREYLNAMQTQAEKLSFLIQSLIKISRLETGIISLHPKKQDIREMLEEMVDAYREKAREKGLRLCDRTEHCQVCFDRKWTAEAVGNILDNAVKYTSQGRVEIRTSRYGMFTAIEVEDTGLGLDEEEIPEIFKRFYRGREVQEQEGVGIGLYLSREILAGQGGYIKVTSQKGKGSVFALFLPNAGE